MLVLSLLSVTFIQSEIDLEKGPNLKSEEKGVKNKECKMKKNYHGLKSWT